MKLPLHVSESKTAASNINAVPNSSENSCPQQAAEHRNVSSKRPINHFRHTHFRCACRVIPDFGSKVPGCEDRFGKGEGPSWRNMQQDSRAIWAVPIKGHQVILTFTGWWWAEPRTRSTSPGLERCFQTLHVCNKPALSQDWEKVFPWTCHLLVKQPSLPHWSFKNVSGELFPTVVPGVLHPQQIGQDERMVQVVQWSWKLILGGIRPTKFATFLIAGHATLCSWGGVLLSHKIMRSRDWPWSLSSKATETLQNNKMMFSLLTCRLPLELVLTEVLDKLDEKTFCHAIIKGRDSILWKSKYPRAARILPVHQVGESSP